MKICCCFGSWGFKATRLPSIKALAPYFQLLDLTLLKGLCGGNLHRFSGWSFFSVSFKFRIPSATPCTIGTHHSNLEPRTSEEFKWGAPAAHSKFWIFVLFKSFPVCAGPPAWTTRRHSPPAGKARAGRGLMSSAPWGATQKTLWTGDQAGKWGLGGCERRDQSAHQWTHEGLIPQFWALGLAFGRSEMLMFLRATLPRK